MARNIGNHFENADNAENRGEAGGQEVFSHTEYIEQPDQPVYTEEGGSGRGHGKKGKGGKIALIVILVAVIAVAGFFIYWYFGRAKAVTPEEEAQLLETGLFTEGVSVEGIDLSGKTIEQARPEAEKKAQEMLDAISISYTVNGEEIRLNAQDMGAVADVETALEQAMLYGRNGATAEGQSAAVDIPISYSEQAIAAAVAKNSTEIAGAAEDATVELKTSADEEKKLTDYELAFAGGKAGFAVDQKQLVSDLYNAVTTGDFSTVTARVEEVQPTVTREDLEKQYAVRGIYKTEYADSASGRRYNIWKMANVINGVKIEPGETWSVNEEAGPRTYANGWDAAPGINNGEYVDEPGGGICQVSSTLYNAVLRAEVTVADRSHHSWPLSYVPGGLDATISTGKPDFKITNNYDIPIYIVTRCDGEGARTIEVAILGPPYEDGLTRDFTSELVSTFGGGGVTEVPDASLPAGTRQTIIGEHIGKKFQVTKHWYDENGNEVKSEVLPELEIYSYKPAKVRVGTGPGGTTEDGNMPAWVQPDTW